MRGYSGSVHGLIEGMSAPSAPPVASGEVVGGKYRVGEVIGSGGMGTVVAAEHVSFEQRVAIKFMHPEGGADALHRFHREANVVVQLRSEHVCRVLDHGTLASGDMYIVMELLEGLDLDQWIRAHGPMPIAVAVEFLLQASDALTEAHLAGVIHRDLKPSNIFLTERGDGSPCVKLLDFGISKDTGATAALTATGALLGSVHFMSPEQLDNAKTVDVRSDIWSLGATLHQLLCGEVPFDAPSLSEMAIKIMYDPPSDIAALRPDAESIAPVVARCLAKHPEERFENLAALAVALAPFAHERARPYVDRIVGMYERVGWSRPQAYAPPTNAHPDVGGADATMLDDTRGASADSTLLDPSSYASHPPLTQPLAAQPPRPIERSSSSAAQPSGQPSPGRRMGGVLLWLPVSLAVLTAVTLVALFAAPPESTADDDQASVTAKKKKKTNKKKSEQPDPGGGLEQPDLPKLPPSPARSGSTVSTKTWFFASTIHKRVIDATGDDDTPVFRMVFYETMAVIEVVTQKEPVVMQRYYFRDGALSAPEAMTESESYTWRELDQRTVELDEMVPDVIPLLPGKAVARGVNVGHVTAVTLRVAEGKGFWDVETLDGAVSFDRDGSYVGNTLNE